MTRRISAVRLPAFLSWRTHAKAKKAAARKTSGRTQAPTAALTGRADNRVEREVGYGPGKFQPGLSLMRGLGGAGR